MDAIQIALAKGREEQKHHPKSIFLWCGSAAGTDGS